MVFFDASGKRWIRIKRSATGLTIIGVIAVAGLVVGVLSYQPKWGTLAFPQQTAATSRPTQSPVQHLLNIFSGTSTSSKSSTSTTTKTTGSPAPSPKVTAATYSQSLSSTSPSSTSADTTSSPTGTTTTTPTSSTTTTTTGPTTTTTTTHGNSTYGQSHKSTTTMTPAQ